MSHKNIVSFCLVSTRLSVNLIFDFREKLNLCGDMTMAGFDLLTLFIHAFICRERLVGSPSY